VPGIEKQTGKNTKRLDQIGGGKPGPGRKPGIPNKANGLLKDAIIQAAEEAGGREGIVGYLTQQAKRHPQTFLGLLGRVLPLQVQAHSEGSVRITIRHIVDGGEVNGPVLELPAGISPAPTSPDQVAGTPSQSREDC
jgi:hypothetical protein